MADEKKIKPSDLKAEAQRLVESGKMPDLDALLSAVADARKKYNTPSGEAMELQKHKEEGFNPERFRTQTGEDTELRPLGKKKNPLGKAKK